MPKPATSSSKVVNVILGLATGAIVFVLLLRHGSNDTRWRLYTTWLYATGKAEGCTLEKALFPLEIDMQRAGAGLADRVRENRTEGPLVVWDTPHGEMRAPPETPVLHLLSEQAVDVYDASAGGIEPGDVVIDCGANIGAFSRVALDSGASLVVSIEPSPLNVASLLKNFAREIEQGRLIVVPKAVWHEPGTMMLRTYDHSVLDTLVMNDRYEGKVQSEVEVELVTIDNLVQQLGLARLDVLKMDIEGAERNALRGSFETIRRFRPTLSIAAENLPDDISAVPAVVREALPEYEMTPGRCRVIQDGYLRPEAMHFQLARN